MGNKASRRRAEAGAGVNSSSKSHAASKSSPAAAVPAVHVSAAPPHDDTDKGVSCPDLSAGAVPYRDRTAAISADTSTSGPRQVNYTVYRSYSNVAEASRRYEPPRPNIRVYRRNTGAARSRYSAPIRRGDAAERSQTLPRGFGRSRSAMSGLQSTDGDTDSSTLPRGGGGGRYTTGAELKRQTALGLSASSGLGPPVDTKPAKRTSSTVSMTSIGYRATADDLPDTATIKRRLAQFETVFARALAKLYTSLADSVQLSSLSIAVQPDRANQHISLWQYLNSADVPLDLLAAGDTAGDGPSPGYVLTIQPALFSGVMHVRRERRDDPAALVSLAGELVACLAAEAAGELARIFEYQIALLSDGLAIELLAGHGAHCVINYMTTSGRHLDRNTIVLGAVRGQHTLESTVITPRLSIIVGQKELKWELDEILKRPGLRKELFLFSDDIEVDEDNPPWRFYTSSYQDPMLYGYRGLIVEWDYIGAAAALAGGTSELGVTSAYRLNGEDEASFPYEVDARPDDFHRHYCPYRRLVGAGVVDMFNRCASGQTADVEMRGSSSLAEFVRRLQGSAYARDHIQPVYRPINILPPPTTSDQHNEQRAAASRDDWYAMVDQRDHTHTLEAPDTSGQTNYPIASRVSAVVTSSTATSNQLPVVQEASAEDQPNGGDEPLINGKQQQHHVNGNVDHYVGEPEVVDDVTRMNKMAVMTIVRQVNGDASVENDVSKMSGVNGSVHHTELHDNDAADASSKTSPSFGYITDQANRRTVRSDL